MYCWCGCTFSCNFVPKERTQLKQFLDNISTMKHMEAKERQSYEPAISSFFFCFVFLLLIFCR